MQAQFWLDKWQVGQTGWHQAKPSPLLEAHWPTLNVPPQTRVLVPLCGKSLDMAWLTTQDLRVLGVELSPLAVEAFFAEHGLSPEKQQAADGVHYTAGNIEIIQGDLFGVAAATLTSCGAIYDRAAIIAQPPEQRRRYADEIYAKLPAGCRGLIITTEYDQTEMDGPPFSVKGDELDILLGQDWAIDCVDRRAILDHEPKFRDRGLTHLDIAVRALQRR